MKCIALMPRVNFVPIAFVNDEDYDLLAHYTWFLNGSGYASRNVPGERRTLFMHREVAAAPSGAEVHHRNANTLDNRRDNLTVCSRFENAWATKKKRTAKYSKYKGVTFIKSNPRNPWMAQIKQFGKQHYLGSYATEEAAAMAYNAAATKMFGEFAVLNVLGDAALSRHTEKPLEISREL